MSYHSSFAQPPREPERQTDSPADAGNFDYYRFSGEGCLASASRRRACADREPTDLQLVDDSTQHPFVYSQDDLRHAKSTAARLTALEKIASSGEGSFIFKDKDGVDREFRVETQQCGEKTLIQCFAKDSRGSEQVVMRAARNASGEIEQQRNADGKLVSYYGDNWSRSMQGKTYLVGEKPESKPPEVPKAERCRESDKGSPRQHEQKSPRERSEGGQSGREPKGWKRGGDRWQERDFNADPRMDVGRVLANVASIAAPFLMAQLSNRGRCNDLYTYRDYPRNLPERGCSNYYDGNNRHCYDGSNLNHFDPFRRHDFDEFNRRWGRPHHSSHKGYRQSHCR